VGSGLFWLYIGGVTQLLLHGLGDVSCVLARGSMHNSEIGSLNMTDFQVAARLETFVSWCVILSLERR
jgi:hypothetical protein